MTASKRKYIKRYLDRAANNIDKATIQLENTMAAYLEDVELTISTTGEAQPQHTQRAEQVQLIIDALSAIKQGIETFKQKA